MLDIIIPVYNAYDALKNCLASVEKHNAGADNVILINDASTDPRIKDLIHVFASRNNWKVITHKVNLGFVKTANEGLRLSNGHSILLNSDTIVSKNWLKAFKQAILNCKDMATATAWSNNAEICSLPHFLQNNQIPQDIDELSEIIYNNYLPQYPEIPTAVGFCMLITSQAKEKVGFLDEQHFGHGYGEENDYSLRADEQGMKNIICDNAYVVHLGNESFSDIGMKPGNETMNRLLEKHPDYLKLIQKYIEDDPAKEIRNKLIGIINEKNPNLLIH